MFSIKPCFNEMVAEKAHNKHHQSLLRQTYMTTDELCYVEDILLFHEQCFKYRTEAIYVGPAISRQDLFRLRGVLLNYTSRAVAREFRKTSFSGKPFWTVL